MLFLYKRLQYIILIALLSLSLGNPAFANDNVNLCVTSNNEPITRGRHSLDTTIDAYHFLIQPGVNCLVGGIVGSKYAGKVGFAIGCLVGIFAGGIDEKLIAQEDTDTRHLSMGVTGVGLLSSLALPYHLAPIIGFSGGILISFDLLGELHDHGKAPLEGMLHGFIIFNGNKGALIGGIAGSIDEILATQNYTDKHILSEAMSSIAVAKVFVPIASGVAQKLPIIGPIYTAHVLVHALPFAAEGLGIAWAAYKMISTEAMDTHQNTTSVTPAEIMKDLKETLGPIIGEDKVNAMMKQQSLSLAGMAVVQAKLTEVLSYHQQKMATALASFETFNPQVMQQFQGTLKIFFPFIIPYVSWSLTQKPLENHYHTYWEQASSDHLYAKYISGEILLKLKQDPDVAALVYQMDKDIRTASTSGFQMISGIISLYIQGSYQIFFLSTNQALDIVILLKTYHRATESFTIFLNNQQLELRNKLQDVWTKVNTLQTELNENTKLLITGDKKDFLAYKQEQLIAEGRDLEGMSKIIGYTFFSWITGKFLLDDAVQISFIAYKLYKKVLPYENYQAVLLSGNSASSLFSWYSNNANLIIELQTAMNRTRTLVAKIQENTLKEEDTSLEYATREYDHIQLILANFSVGYANTTLLKEQDLHLDASIYAVTGKSGSGKSSFLSKIKKIRHNGLWAKGKITYSIPTGKALSIHQATQEDYIVPYSTLFEVITLQDRKKLAKDPDLKQKVITLLKEIGIDDKGDEGIVANLDEEKDWRSILSGGQKKKIAVISTILAQPHIAIMDEVFASLDPVSVKKTQAMLKKYLPQTLFLIVDHNVAQNNYDGFYNEGLHLENQTIHRKTIPIALTTP